MSAERAPAAPPGPACCANPDPAILQKNGRLFCRSCRAYLDKPDDGSKEAASKKKDES